MQTKKGRSKRKSKNNCADESVISDAKLLQVRIIM